MPSTKKTTTKNKTTKNSKSSDKKTINNLKKQLNDANSKLSDTQSKYDQLANESTKSEYTTNEIASKAASDLTSALNAPERYRNTLGDYVAEGTQLRNDYKDYMDYNSVLGKYNDATDAAYALSKQEQIQAMNKAEASNYANTKAGIKSLRDSLVGSASSGANVGASNATALQALLGLGQTNAQTTTEGMQAYQNNAKEMASQRAANATTALEFNKSATDSMYSNATSAYGSDMSAMGQAAYGAGQGLGELGGAIDTNASQERQNNASNATNILTSQIGADATTKSAEINADAQKYAARKGQKSTIINKKG